MSCRTDREIGRKSYLLCLVLYTKSSTTSFTYFFLFYPSIHPYLIQQYTSTTSAMELFPFTTHYDPPSLSFSSFSSFFSSLFPSLTTTTKIINNNNPTAISSLFLTFSIMSLFVSLFFWWIIFQVNWSFLLDFRFLQFASIYGKKKKRKKKRSPC